MVQIKKLLQHYEFMKESRIDSTSEQLLLQATVTSGLLDYEALIAELRSVLQTTKQSVPYQLCPKCNGMRYFRNTYHTTGIDIPCDICTGSGIIPQHPIDSREVVQDEKNTDELPI